MKKDEKKFNKQLAILIIVIVSILVICAVLDYYSLNGRQKKFVEEEVLRVKAEDLKGDFVGIDGWGNRVK